MKMAKKRTLSQFLAAFPRTITTKETLPKKVSLKSIIQFISNGKTGVLSKLSYNERNMLKSFLNRLRYSFKEKVKVLPNGSLIFNNVKVEDWEDKTKFNIKGFGTGSINVNQEAIRDGIDRLLEYIEETEETKIPFSKISLITMGVNIAKLKGKERVYNKNPFQTFEYLFSELGLKAEIKEEREKDITKIMSIRKDRYCRDWSPFTTTYLIVDYKDIDDISEARKKLKEKTISGGFLLHKMIPGVSPDCKRAEKLTRKETYDLNRYVPIYMESESLTKKLLVSNAIMQKYITLQSDLIKEKDKKIDFLEKEVRRLEDGLIAITG